MPEARGPVFRRPARIVYVAIFSVLCVLRLITAKHGDPDFGIFEQAFWTTTHQGMLLSNTYEGGSHFRIHNSPVFLLLVPAYWAVPTLASLLVAQTIAMAAGAWAVFLLARQAFSREAEPAAAMLAVAYLLYHPMHGVNYDQFNELAFATAPIIFAFYHLYGRRYGWFWVFSLLALATKEDMSFLVGMLGLYAAAVSYPDRRGMLSGLGLACFAGVWLWFSMQVVFPYFRGPQPWPYFTLYYGHLGNSMGEAVRTILTRPDIVLPLLIRKKTVLLFLELVAPLAFFPLRAPGVLLVGGPTWLVFTLSSFQGTTNTGSRYMAPLVAVLFVALVLGMRGMTGNLNRIARWPLILSLLFMLAIDNTPVRLPFKNIPVVTDHVRERWRLAAMVPEDASVSTQGDFYALLARRLDVSPEYLPDKDYILVDDSAQFKLWYDHAHFPEHLPRLLNEGRYTLVASSGGARLYKKTSQ